MLKITDPAEFSDRRCDRMEGYRVLDSGGFIYANKIWALVLICVAGGGTALCQTLEFFGSEISTPANFVGVTQGVAVGDFNGDGKPDLALVTSGDFSSSSNPPSWSSCWATATGHSAKAPCIPRQGPIRKRWW